MRHLSLRTAVVVAMLLIALPACRSGPPSADPANPNPALDVGGTSAQVEPQTVVEIEPTRARVGELVPVAFAPGGLIEAQLADLIAVTERLRGRRFVTPPMVAFVSSTEAARLRAAGLQPIVQDPRVETRAALLELLGIFDRREDLPAFMAELQSTRAEAVYDWEYRDLVIPLDGRLLTPYEQWVIVHELTHALMQQNYPDTAAALRHATDGSSDEPLALAALAEGEAVLIQTLFYAELPPAEQQAVLREATERAGSSVRGAPPYLRTTIRFPFTEGAEFAVDLFGRGGLRALDQAFARPPWTSEQVLHPERYIALEQAPPAQLGRMRVPSYDVVEDGVWGELGWRALLGEAVNGATVDVAATGWRSDRYEVHWDADSAQVAMTARIDTASTRDGSELAAALIVFVEDHLGLEARLVTNTTEDFIGADYAAVARHGSSVTLVIASNPIVGLQMADQLDLIPAGFMTFPPAGDVEGQ